eukprot:2670185-Heterocapsa_arctica.AAC.1
MAAESLKRLITSTRTPLCYGWRLWKGGGLNRYCKAQLKARYLANRRTRSPYTRQSRAFRDYVGQPWMWHFLYLAVLDAIGKDAAGILKDNRFKQPGEVDVTSGYAT